MDWEKWRKEEDARQQDVVRAQELRKILGLENRSCLRFWFDMATTATAILLSIILVIVELPSVIEVYRNDPTLLSRAWTQTKNYLPHFATIYAITIALCVLFSKK